MKMKMNQCEVIMDYKMPMITIVQRCKCEMTLHEDEMKQFRVEKPSGEHRIK